MLDFREKYFFLHLFTQIINELEEFKKNEQNSLEEASDCFSSSHIRHRQLFAPHHHRRHRSCCDETISPPYGSNHSTSPSQEANGCADSELSGK